MSGNCTRTVNVGRMRLQPRRSHSLMINQFLLQNRFVNKLINSQRRLIFLVGKCQVQNQDIPPNRKRNKTFIIFFQCLTVSCAGSENSFLASHSDLPVVHSSLVNMRCADNRNYPPENKKKMKLWSEPWLQKLNTPPQAVVNSIDRILRYSWIPQAVRQYSDDFGPEHSNSDKF